MNFRLKEGVVLFRMCGDYYIFPSRKAEGLVHFILSASPELVSVLQNEAGSSKEISSDTKNKLKHLAAAGYIEEY